MRMRRKKHLEDRLAACGDMIIYMDRDDRDYRIKDSEHMIDPVKLFGNDKPVVLEVGCGKGQFIRELAKREPQFNYLAVEKASNVVVDAAEQTIAEGIENIRFMRGGAEYLDCYIPQGIVQRIYLNFSCPFPKKSYAKHRLTHRNFLKIYEGLLVKGGEIHQKTDNMQLFEFSIAEFSQSGWGIQNVSLDLHNSDFEGNIVTEYERRFTEMGMPIYRLEAYKL
ncbi:tRNA (guanine-N7-)-methyltransferase [Ruminococcus sp. YE71]|uniref:tRNA (guanosine(46)-N7)-methyltransferase TrmB n=1 Tax=unclassified Ruminococcus TaxID=2608920 RepID=UPI000884437B|nr:MULTISPECIES: tRNA (guanosine(46)-N7)-methyltransferase TrmB [unclassified Ruminococcus]SDA23508.1 tRNA (guanine-N7-)-methyltransferase [Ruminococcus sp. YE78]SFW39894.1 tRNA (guanine-N7-)-methyltransferase [Ruminococcus sp. YE71]